MSCNCMTGKNEKRREKLEMKVRKITVEEFMQIIEKKLALLIKKEKAERRRGRMKKMGAR